MTALEPIRSSAAHSFSYYGTREGWLIALAVNRDSDTVERSNWRVIVPEMVVKYPEDAAVERMNHWTVGWVDYLLVRPGTEAEDAALVWANRLADYPLADESDHLALEWAEEWCAKCDRGTREDHPLAGCRFRSADEADEIRWRWAHRREVA